MKVQLNLRSGLSNDLLIEIERDEIRDAHLHIANRKTFMELPGLIRHQIPADDSENREHERLKKKNRRCKISVEEHLEQLGLYTNSDDFRGPNCRVIAIGNRNLGNNQGFIAWQEDEIPDFFEIQNDLLRLEIYSCLVMEKTGALSFRCLRRKDNGGLTLEDGADVHRKVKWAAYGHHVLRSGRIVDLEQIIGEFYDIRQVLAYDRKQINPSATDRSKWHYRNFPDGATIENKIYKDFPSAFRENARDALLKGVPRARYFQNSIGLSKDKIFILQCEGTVEEIAQRLRDAGAEDGLIFDCGGSVFTWAWFVDAYKGGFLFAAPDFRPPTSALLAFVLKGPVCVDLPGGSVSPAVF